MTLKRQLLALATMLTAAAALLLFTRTAEADTVPAPVPATLADRGNFRMRCEFSHLAADDPLVLPNQAGASHLHMFFGNTKTTAFSTPDAIRTGGGTTCQGGTSANRSAYWIPTVHDANGGVRVPNFALFYYKTAGLEPSSVQMIPDNLRIIAGSADGGNTTNEAYWSCADGNFRRSTTIPDCPANQTLFMTIHFPSCWDGSNLDSRNHKSHMAYARWNGNGRSCPSSHPVPLPEISFSFQFEHPEGSTRGWYLSSDDGAAGGSTLHGDWMNGWNRSVMQTFLTNCLHAQRDCTGGQLGNGTKLSMTSSNGRGSAAILDVGDAPPAPAPEPVAETPAPEPVAETTTTTTTAAPVTTDPPAAVAPTTSVADDTAAAADDAPVTAVAPAAIIERDVSAPIPNGPTCAGMPATIVGTDGNDVLVGTPGRDVIVAGAGHDTIRGLGGNDVLCGGPGRDRIMGGKGADIVSGGSGRDRIRGGAGGDTLSGDRGADRISGGRGDDILRGGSGEDRLRGAGGADLLFQ